MGDLNINFDTDDKSIVLNDSSASGGASIQVNHDDENIMLGVDLLANKNNTREDGYSSGEEKQSSPTKETLTKSYEFFNNDTKPSEPEPPLIQELEEPTKKINVPIDDSLINSIKEKDSSGFKSIHEMNTNDIKNEKIDLIYKFKKLENQGVRTTLNYNMNSSLDDMRNEYLKLKKQREIDNSVKFQRKMMMAAITGLEFMNNKFDPFDIKLDGWSESVNENLNDYDEIFEELYDKYGGVSTELAPEIRLVMMLGGSAFMFHLTNTLFKTSIPGMDDIMKQNPELMKQFAKAAVSSIGKTPEEPSMPKNPPSNSRRDMDGSSGVDDLINSLNLQPNDIPDLDNISIMSGETGRLSNNSGITMNL